MIKFFQNSFIGKHWRGDYSLPFSYWLISFCTNITIIFTSAIIVGYLEAQPYFNPYILAFSNLLLLTSLVFINVWHFFGTWRSATFYSLKAENIKSYWGGIAKAMLIFGAIKSVGWIIPYCNSVVVFLMYCQLDDIH